MEESIELLNNIYLQDGAEAGWSWYLAPSKGYTINNAYHMLMEKGYDYAG